MSRFPHQFVTANSLTPNQIGRLLDVTVLTNREDDVIEGLRIIVPGVERIRLIGEQNGQTHRIPVLKVSGYDGVLPLRSMGEGMGRAFGILLSLVNAKNGILLIDEVENGLHYTVLYDMWRLIFRVAHELNVQVFATTHSWDCIEAFQKAACEAQEEEGMLIRLENRKGNIVPTLFDEQRLAIITREQIEVR